MYNKTLLHAYQKFITESENRINAYEKEIAGLKIKIAEEKKTEKAKYEKKLAELEKKNNDLKNRITDYKNKQLDNWDEKQHEFRKDLDELGNSIAGFFNQD
jgi:chromosome segregation ATPase